MSVALIESSFLSNPFTQSFRPRTTSTVGKHVSIYISCTHTPQPDHNHQHHSTRKSENSSSNSNQLAKLALVAVAAGVLTLGSVDPAAAAKSGGRVGGQAFRSAAPRPSAPRTNNSRTNIYINPPVAPPLGGYGYGVPYYGGFGWSPFSFFAPAPTVAVGVGGGFDPFLLFIALGAFTAVFRRFFGSRRDDDDDY